MNGALPSRAGMVAVVGRANAGKSTLVNALLEEKVSIVTPVCQTTRTLVRGVLTDPRGQCVFLDTPGVHKTSSELGRVMNRIARASVEGTDFALLVLDASSPPAMEDRGWMRRLARGPVACLAVLNKIDAGTVREDEYRACWREAAAACGSDRRPDWRRASALRGDGVTELRDELLDRMPEGPLLFPPDVLSDYPRKLTMADLIREQLMVRLRDELPHEVAVRIEDIDEEGAGWRVTATVFVNRPTQRGIVIGHKGRLIRAVRRSASRALSEVYERPVELALWVKVQKNWPRNYFLLRQLGYLQ